MVETGAARCIVNNAEVVSRQDTILANSLSSQLYCYNSTIRGNFDFIWGGGNMYFDKCNIHNLGGTGSGNVTAARTATNLSSSTYLWLNPSGTYTANGVSFVNSTFTADAGVTGITLAGGNGGAGNNASWARCKFASSYITPSALLFSGNFLFWQYQNTDSAGTTPVTFSSLTTLPDADSRLLAATNVASWFYGWTPQLAPNILTNPVGSYLAPGGTVNLAVTATGIPEPTYRWLKNGTNVPGATSATLAIPGAAATDSGTYSVVVSNSAGSVVSSAVAVTVNTSPVASNAPASTTVNTPLLLPAAKVALYASDADGNALTLTGVSATSTNGGSVTLVSGTITYTPVTDFIGVDQFNYTVSDGLGGTATGTVTVSVVASGSGFNQLSVQPLGADVVLTYLGIPTLNYALDRTFNLTPPVTWVPQITNPAAGNGYLIFTNTPNPSTNNFWRTRYVP